MQLSKRLQAVANLVTQGNRVADVGCDHAYTSIYMAENRISPHVIAMDINQGPIDRARENIIKYGYENQIEVRKSDGLKKLEAGEADTVIIAGMGGGLIVQILSERMEVMKSLRELVLQPQSETFKVRHLLMDNNFIIIEENMIKEDGKFYVMMKAVPQKFVKDTSTYQLALEEHLYYGRLLLEQKNPILAEYLLWDLEICKGIINTLEEERTENTLLRLEEINNRMELIHRGLEYYKQEA
ncbi:MAG: class I SAM-dependent methyltransferase [Herbinix sp.]|nr:class I SAM-dependent methyltransferase [Herbinix sp.]